MSRARWGPLAALTFLTAEIVAFVAVGNLIGFALVVLLVLAASVAGLLLVRREGLRAWRRFQDAVASGAPPGPQVTDGVIGLSGALLLAMPGLVSGAAGAALLSPPVRRLARGRMQARAERRMSSAEAGQVFGPRRVRVWHSGPETPSGTGTGTEAEVVEGEIVDPGERPAG